MLGQLGIDVTMYALKNRQTVRKGYKWCYVCHTTGFIPGLFLNRDNNNKYQIKFDKFDIFKRSSNFISSFNQSHDSKKPWHGTCGMFQHNILDEYNCTVLLLRLNQSRRDSTLELEPPRQYAWCSIIPSSPGRNLRCCINQNIISRNFAQHLFLLYNLLQMPYVLVHVQYGSSEQKAHV